MNDTTTTPAIPLLCRLNLHHHYHYEYTEDGRRYSRCARCGKDDPHLGARVRSAESGGHGADREALFSLLVAIFRRSARWYLRTPTHRARKNSAVHPPPQVAGHMGFGM